MKIVPLYPNLQPRTVQPSRSSREKSRPDEPRAGITVDLSPRIEQASDLSRDEAFILLGRTMAQLSRPEDRAEVGDLHLVRTDKAVDLLIQE